MKKTLYQHKIIGENNEPFLYIQITVHFNENQNLVISGYDSGSVTKSISGNFDYEYYLTIEPSEVQKLKKIIGKESDNELLSYFEAHFSNEECINQIKEICKSNSINYDFSVWR